jgi:hypothetical protein
MPVRTCNSQEVLTGILPIFFFINWFEHTGLDLELAEKPDPG